MVQEAVQELDRSYYASWHSVRANPELVRAKAQALKDVQARVLAKLADLGLDA